MTLEERESEGWKVEGSQGKSLLLHDEREALLEVMRPGMLICEAGTYHGATCRYWASKVPEARFICVDAYVGIPDKPADAVSLWMANRLPNMKLFVGSLRELFSLFYIAYPRTFDLVFIDAGHTKEQCYDDLAVSRQLLEYDDGILAVHDYHFPDPGIQGPTEAVDEYLGKFDARISRQVDYTVFLEGR